MSKTNIDHLGYGDGFMPNSAPGNFELDEIEWDEKGYSTLPDSIPFEKAIKKIRAEQEQLLAPAKNEL